MTSNARSLATVYKSKDTISSDEDDDANYDENNHWKKRSPTGLTVGMDQMCASSLSSSMSIKDQVPDSPTGFKRTSPYNSQPSIQFTSDFCNSNLNLNSNSNPPLEESQRKRHFAHISGPLEATSGLPSQLSASSTATLQTEHHTIVTTYRYNWPVYSIGKSVTDAHLMEHHVPMTSGKANKYIADQCHNVTSYMGKRINVNVDNLAEYLKVLAHDYVNQWAHTTQETAPDPVGVVDGKPPQGSVGIPRLFFDVDEKNSIIWTKPDGTFREDVLDRFVGTLVRNTIAKFFPSLKDDKSLAAIVTVSRPVVLDKLVETEPRSYSSGLHIVFPHLAVDRFTQMTIRSTIRAFFKSKTQQSTPTGGETSSSFKWEDMIDVTCLGLRVAGALNCEKCKTCTKNRSCGKCVMGRQPRNLGIYMFYKSFDHTGSVLDVYPLPYVSSPSTSLEATTSDTDLPEGVTQTVKPTDRKMTIEEAIKLFELATVCIGLSQTSVHYKEYALAAMVETKSTKSPCDNPSVKRTSLFLHPDEYKTIYQLVAKLIPANGREAWSKLFINRITAIGIETDNHQLKYKSLLVEVQGIGSTFCLQKMSECKKLGQEPTSHKSNHIYFEFVPYAMLQKCHDSTCKELRKLVKPTPIMNSLKLKIKQQMLSRMGVGMFDISDEDTFTLFPFLRSKSQLQQTPQQPATEEAPKTLVQRSANSIYLEKCAQRNKSNSLVKTKPT